jgi:SRSO17 transposase
MGAAEDWQDDLLSWLGPFLGHLGHKARRRMCPLYVAGLIGPGERKSVQPMALPWGRAVAWRPQAPASQSVFLTNCGSLR